MNLTNKRSRNKLLSVLVLTVVLLIIGLAFLVQIGGSVWLNRYTPQLEKAITNSTGMNTRIQGGISLQPLPVPAIRLNDIKLSEGDQTRIDASVLKIEFALLGLLNKEFRVQSINLDRLRLKLYLDEKGKLVLPSIKSKPTLKPTGSFRLVTKPPVKIEFHNSEISIRSPKNEELYSVKGIKLNLNPVDASAITHKNGSMKLDHTGNLRFQKARLHQLEIGPSKLGVRISKNHIEATVFQSRVFDGNAKGKFLWTRKLDTPAISATLSLTSFDAAKSSELFKRGSFVQGRLNLEADLSTTGSNQSEAISRAQGKIKLSGSNLRLVSVNLDNLITRIIKSESYNLFDAAAYFFVGPLGMTVTKGYDFVSVTQEMKRPDTIPSTILRLVSAWDLKDGIATARDVALETSRNRLVLKGRINLNRKEFDNLRIGIIDNRGCAIVSQRLEGPISAPRVEKMNILIKLTRPLWDVFGKSTKRLFSGDCDRFYDGELLDDVKTRESTSKE